MSVPNVGDTVTVMRGETPVQIYVPTPEELNGAVIDAAMAVGALRGVADGLADRPDVGHVAPTIHKIANDLERFIALAEPDYSR